MMYRTDYNVLQHAGVVGARHGLVLSVVCTAK